MKNKKGFTLVELLAVIALLAVLAAVATPAIQKVSRSSKIKMCQSKKKVIESAAVMYAEKELSASSGTIKVMRLCEQGYLSKEEGSTCQKNPLGGTFDNNNVTLTKPHGNRWAATLNVNCE